MPTTMSEKIGRSNADAEFLTLQVMNLGIREMPFRLKYTARMFKMKNAFTHRFSMSIQSCQFLFKGRSIKDGDTPRSLKMRDNDIVHVTNQNNTVSPWYSSSDSDVDILENNDDQQGPRKKRRKEVEHLEITSDSDMDILENKNDHQGPRKKRQKLSNAHDNNEAQVKRRHGGSISPDNASADSSRKGPRRLHKNPKPQEEEDEQILDTPSKRILHKSIGLWMTWMDHELCEYLHPNEWDSYKTETLKLIIEYKNRSERQRREDLQPHQQHSQQQHGAGPSGWEPMTSQQQFQTLNQNRTPPPQAMSPHRLSTENSHSDLIIGQVINRDHGAPRDPIFIKQEPGLNTSQESDSSTSQESELNTSQESGLNTSQGPGLNTAQGSGLNTSQESGLNNSQGSGLNISQGSGLNTSQNLAPQPPPQAMPPPRLSTEGSLADLLISQAISAARGAKQEPGHNSSQGSGTNTSQGPGCNTLQGSGTNTLQGSGRKTSQESGTNTSEGSGSNTLQGSRTNILQESGCKTSQGPGTNTSQGSGSKIPEDSGTSTPQGSGGNTSQGPGTNTSQGSGRNTSQGPGSNTSQGSGSKTPEESGTSTPQGSGGNTSQGPGTNTSQGSGRNTSQGPGSNTSQRFGRNTSKGFGRNTSQGPGTNTSQRFGRNISKGFGRNTSQGPGTNTSQRFGRNASQGSGRNASQGPGRNCTYQGSWTNTPQGSSKGAGGWSKNK